MLAYCDETSEALAGILRPGNAGSNSAADQVAVVEQSLAQVPIELIETIEILVRASGRHTTIADGPEVLFGIRNKLVHPPMKMTEWPSSAELKESWQLANWYLELVVLRELDDEGKYWSRLRLGRQAADLEPVPWAGSRGG